MAPNFTYATPGTRLAKLRVNDPDGASDVASISIQAGNTPPVAQIAEPSAALTWAVGDRIPLVADASDAQDGTLPGSAYTWKVIIHHCPSNCHEHTLETIEGKRVASLTAPDHEFPSWLELELTVTDSGGLTDTESVEIHPRTVTLGLESSPAGFALQANDRALGRANRWPSSPAPPNTVIAPAAQTRDGIDVRLPVLVRWRRRGARHPVEFERDADRDLRQSAGRADDRRHSPRLPGNVGSPRVKGTLGRGDPTRVEIFTNAACSGDPAATGSSEEFVSGWRRGGGDEQRHDRPERQSDERGRTVSVLELAELHRGLGRT